MQIIQVEWQVGIAQEMDLRQFKIVVGSSRRLLQKALLIILTTLLRSLKFLRSH